MRKRFLSIFLVLALCLAFLPVTPVYAASYNVDDGTNYNTLQEAIALASDGDTLVLMDDISTGLDTDALNISLALDLHGHTFQCADFQSDIDWVFVDSVGGGAFDGIDITLGANGSTDTTLALDGSVSYPFTFTATYLNMLGDSPYITIQGGVTVEIDDIEGTGPDAGMEIATSNVTIGTLRLSGSSASLYISESEATFTNLEMHGDAPSMGFNESTITANDLLYICDNPLDLTKTTLTINHQLNMGYSTASANAFTLDNDSMIIVNNVFQRYRF